MLTPGNGQSDSQGVGRPEVLLGMVPRRWP
jgi:hypothetical protein